MLSYRIPLPVSHIDFSQCSIGFVLYHASASPVQAVLWLRIQNNYIIAGCLFQLVLHDIQCCSELDVILQIRKIIRSGIIFRTFNHDIRLNTDPVYFIALRRKVFGNGHLETRSVFTDRNHALHNALSECGCTDNSGICALAKGAGQDLG